MIGYSKEKSAFKPNVKVSNAKPPKPISKKSAKRIDEEKVYNKKKKDYLIAFPHCEVKKCRKDSTDIHHKKGRVGSLLTDDNYFMAVCRGCHSEIELNPIWAKENGYSLDRL